MIKFKLKNEEIDEEQIYEKRVYLEIDEHTESLFLKMCDDYHQDWYILEITRNGELDLCGGLGKSTGLVLDDEDRIVIVDE